MAQDQAPVLPSTVRVHFAPYPCGTLSFADLPAEFHTDSQIADAGLEVTAGSSATHSVRDRCHATYTQKGGDPDNKAALQSLAGRIARDFWSWRTVAYDRAYAGLPTPALDGTVDAVTWTHRGDKATTRMRSVPIGGEPLRLAHADPGHDCDGRPKVYGGPTTPAVTNGVLKLGKVALYVDDDTLKWDKLADLNLTICASAAAPADAGDGSGAAS